MRTEEDTGIGGLGIGHIEYEEASMFDRAGASFDHGLNRLIGWVGAKTQAILPKMSETLTSVSERFFTGQHAALVGQVALTDGTIVEMSLPAERAATPVSHGTTGSHPASPRPEKEPDGPNFIERTREGAKHLWEATKQRVLSMPEVFRRTLGKNATGSLVELAIEAEPTTPPPSKEPTNIVPPAPRTPLAGNPYALVGKKTDGSPKVDIVYPASDRAKTPLQTVKPLPKNPADRTPVQATDLTKDIPEPPVIIAEPQPAPAPKPVAKKEITMADKEGAVYGTMPKFAGETMLLAYANSARTWRDYDAGQFAVKTEALSEEKVRGDLEALMNKWGWNDTAQLAGLAMLDEISSQDSKAGEAPKAPVTTPPAPKPPKPAPVVKLPVPIPTNKTAAEQQLADEERKRALQKAERKDWMKYLPLGAALLISSSLITAVLANLGLGQSPTSEAPSPAPTPPSAAPQTPGQEKAGKPNDDQKPDTQDNPEAPQVQTRLKGAEADKKGDFVRMTSYQDRQEARTSGSDFSTVWWIAREQLDAVNGDETPTTPQIWAFTDQTLKHNKLTWDDARRLHAEQKIRLLSDTAAKQVIETTK